MTSLSLAYVLQPCLHLSLTPWGISENRLEGLPLTVGAIISHPSALSSLLPNAIAIEHLRNRLEGLPLTVGAMSSLR
jgi:hypothetical protein